MKINVYVDDVLSVVTGDINIFSNDYVNDEDCNQLFNCSHIDRQYFGTIINGKFEIALEHRSVAVFKGKRIPLEKVHDMGAQTDQIIHIFEWKDKGYVPKTLYPISGI